MTKKKMMNRKNKNRGAKFPTAPLRGQRGTTLLELMFAMIIFGTLLTIMAIFPSAVAKSVRSVSDIRTAIIARSIRDSIKLAMEASYRADDSDDAPSLITVVHDGLFADDAYKPPPALGDEDNSSTAGVLTIQLPNTAVVLDVSEEERELAVRPKLRIVPEGEEGGGEGQPAEVEEGVKEFLLAYTDNPLVRYPASRGRVYKLAQYLRDTDSELYNKDDNLDNYSFDIEVRQAVRERRPRDINGSAIYNTKLRVYELIPNVYEFQIRIYYDWEPLTEASRLKGLENRTLLHQFSFLASTPELEIGDD